MNILIAGSGIGGLTCAIALRRQGHHVKVFEQSRLNQETGAAIFLPPNVNGLLRDLGFVPEQYGANFCLGWRQYTALGEEEVNDRFSVQAYSAPWQMIHRQKLHEGLKALAQSPDAIGPPVKIVTAARVISGDPESATIVLEGGAKVHGDAIIGADGIGSAMRSGVIESDAVPEPFSAGFNCFRFLVPREILLSDSRTSPAFQARDTLTVWTGEDRKLVCYPCDDNASMNFVAIHPAELSGAASKGWHGQGSKLALLSIYDGFCPEVKATLQHTDPDKIRLYPLLDMHVMSKWTRARLALLGDAAHPFLPHLGQGGAQAIEDALSIGVFLPADTKTSEVASRFEWYEKARKERVHRIQDATRIAGSNRSELAQISFDFQAEREYQFRYDEVEQSRKMLAQCIA